MTFLRKTQFFIKKQAFLEVKLLFFHHLTS